MSCATAESGSHSADDYLLACIGFREFSHDRVPVVGVSGDGSHIGMEAKRRALERSQRGSARPTGRGKKKRVAGKPSESGAGDEVIMIIAGHVSRAMLSRYSHVRMEAKRRALDGIATRQRAAEEKRKDRAERQELGAGGAPLAAVQ